MMYDILKTMSTPILLARCPAISLVISNAGIFHVNVLGHCFKSRGNEPIFSGGKIFENFSPSQFRKLLTKFHVTLLIDSKQKHGTGSLFAYLKWYS